AVRIKVDQPLTKAFAQTVWNMIRQAIGRQANFLILQLDCNGGDTQEARDLAERLRTLKDDKDEFPVMTVAYIPQRAADAAVFLAFGCTEIVMGKDAEIGDFDAAVYRRQGGGLARVEKNPED